MNQRRDSLDKKRLNRDSIIGLGEDSFRKNYYPELQDKIMDLEKIVSRNLAIISTIPDLLLVCDTEGNMTPFGYSTREDEWLMRRLLGDSQSMDFLRNTAMNLPSRNQVFMEEITLTAGSRIYYFEARFHRSEKQEVVIIVRNITESKLMLIQLQEMVEHDTLTSLYNRRMFEIALRTLHQTETKHFTILSIDINGLKFINDTLGHQAGDELIREISKLVSAVFSSFGSIYRVGGDEFAVLLADLDEAEVEKLLVQLNEAVDQKNRNYQIYTLSLAYGYAHHSHGPLNTEYLFQTADNNMYQNKLLKKESTRGTFVNTFMKALEVKDYISEGHADRMEELAILIGEALLLHQDQLDRIILLTKFHDIGKIGIPDSILKKPAALTADEWVVMRSHTSIGERIALESHEIRDIAPLILHHHERWDGKGYPTALCGSDIPVEDRILAVVDSFDAMTNDRPYHSAIPIEEAVKEILSCSGGQFDPVVVEAFCQVYEKLNT